MVGSCYVRLRLTLGIDFAHARLCMLQCSTVASSSGRSQSATHSVPNPECGAISLRLSANCLRSIRGTLARTKEAIRFAEQCHRVGSNEALQTLVEYMENDTRVTKAHPHRILYFCIHLALSLGEMDVAKRLFELAPANVHVLGTSLRVQFLSRLGRLDEALTQLELVLNEDVPRFDTKRKIADEALDELCAAIKAKPDSVLEMRRFRYLQRLLTKYERRTKCSISELLNGSLFDSANEQCDECDEKLDEATVEKIIKIAPFVLSDS